MITENMARKIQDPKHLFHYLLQCDKSSHTAVEISLMINL